MCEDSIEMYDTNSCLPGQRALAAQPFPHALQLAGARAPSPSEGTRGQAGTMGQAAGPSTRVPEL